MAYKISLDTDVTCYELLDSGKIFVNKEISTYIDFTDKSTLQETDVIAKFNAQSLDAKAVVLPIFSKIERIGDTALCGRNLQHAKFPGLLSIDACGLQENNLLEHIELDSIKKIGQGGFLDCKNLQSVKIGSSIEEIAADAFAKSDPLDEQSIQDLTIDRLSTEVQGSETGFGLDDRTVIHFKDPGLQPIPPTPEITAFLKIANGASKFKLGDNGLAYWNQNISAVVDFTDLTAIRPEDVEYRVSDIRNTFVPIFGEKLSAIYSAAFTTCKFYNFKFSNTLTSIGDTAFGECSGLPAADLTHVKTISDYAFQGSDIPEIKFGQSIESIGKLAFDNCNDLSSVHFIGKYKYEVYSMDNYPWGTSPKNIIYDYADPTSALTVDVKSIDNAWLKSYAYSNQTTLDDLISVVIEKTCTNIAANTFIGCTSLLSIYFKDRDGFEVIDMDNWPWGISLDYIYPKPDYSKIQLVLAPRSKKQDILLGTDIIRRFYSNAAVLDLTKTAVIDEDTVLAALRQRGINDKNGAKIAPFLSGQTEIGENAFSNTILMRQVRNFKDTEYSALDVSSLADYAFANVSVIADQSCLIFDNELCSISPTALSNTNALCVFLNRSSALPIVTLSSYPFGLNTDANLYYKDEDDCIIVRSEIAEDLMLSKIEHSSTRHFQHSPDEYYDSEIDSNIDERSWKKVTYDLPDNESTTINIYNIDIPQINHGNIAIPFGQSYEIPRMQLSAEITNYAGTIGNWSITTEWYPAGYNSDNCITYKWIGGSSEIQYGEMFITPTNLGISPNAKFFISNVNNSPSTWRDTYEVYSINNTGVETRILRSYGDSEKTVDILLENVDINKFRVLFNSGGASNPYSSKFYVAIPKTQPAYWNQPQSWTPTYTDRDRFELLEAGNFQFAKLVIKASGKFEFYINSTYLYNDQPDNQSIVVALKPGKDINTQFDNNNLDNRYRIKEAGAILPYRECVLTKAVKTINEYAFFENNISCAIAAYPIESISSYAFDYANTSVNKPLSIENALLEYAFHYYHGTDLSVCTNLVDQYAFYYCDKLSSLYLPETTQLSSNAIHYCNDNMVLNIDKVEELKDKFVIGGLKVLYAKNAKNITGNQMNYYSTLEELHVDNEVQSNIGNGYGNDHQVVVEVNVR